MSLGEFDLIDRYFARLTPARDDIRLGVGDDAAVVSVPPGDELVIATDTLVEGVHFPRDTSPDAIGYKALAVNLSDLAAMGARPAWVTLSLTLPQADADWLDAFAGGFGRLAAESGIALIGGDTTRGPLTVTVTVHGLVPQGQALTRGGAGPEEAVFVSGGLGGAAAALALLTRPDAWPDALERLSACRGRLDYPQPRLALGEALRGLATAVIDVSDGLLADTNHLCAASAVGMEIDVDQVPRDPALAAILPMSDPRWYEWPLAGGDDYELCFIVPQAGIAGVAALEQSLGIALTRIGETTREPGCLLKHADGSLYAARDQGYRHFS